jgi:hypothetical protein
MATDEKNGENNSEPKKLTGNFEIEVDGFKCVLRPPNRFVIQPAMAKMTKTSGEMDMIGAGEIIFNSCKISCDKEIEENDNLLISVFAQCAQLMEIKEATLKKI